MRQLVIFFAAVLLSVTALAAPVPNEALVRQQLEQAEANKNTPDQADIVEQFRLALNILQERKESLARTEQYQHVIDDFPKLTQELRRLLAAEENKTTAVNDKLSVVDLEQKVVQTSSQLLDQSRQLQQERERLREVIDSLAQLPQQQTEASRVLNEIDRQIQSLGKVRFNR